MATVHGSINIGTIAAQAGAVNRCRRRKRKHRARTATLYLIASCGRGRFESRTFRSLPSIRSRRRRSDRGVLCSRSRGGIFGALVPNTAKWLSSGPRYLLLCRPELRRALRHPPRFAPDRPMMYIPNLTYDVVHAGYGVIRELPTHLFGRRAPGWHPHTPRPADAGWATTWRPGTASDTFNATRSAQTAIHINIRTVRLVRTAVLWSAKMLRLARTSGVGKLRRSDRQRNQWPVWAVHRDYLSLIAASGPNLSLNHSIAPQRCVLKI